MKCFASLPLQAALVITLLQGSHVQAAEPIAGAGGSTRPVLAAATQPVEGVAALRRLIQAKSLRLSTDDPSPPDKLQFVLRLSFARKQAEPIITEYVVVKDGDRVGVLVRSIDRLPYCYLTDGLMVLLDRGRPGQFVVYEQGVPEFLFRATDNEEGSLEFGLSHSKRPSKGRIILDIGSVLRHAVEKMSSATFERDTGTIVGRTGRAVLMLMLPAIDRPEEFGLRTFVTRNVAGQTLAFLDVSVGDDPPFHPSRIDQKSIAALGLPIRGMADAERAGVSLLIPENFGHDPNERQASERLAKLFSRTQAAALPPQN